jgi:protein involved in polysaccharide export with SLBB domain
MCAMDLTELRREVEALVARAVFSPGRFPYRDRDVFIETMVDTANTLDDIDRIISDLDERVCAALERAGAVTKRCERGGCGRLIVQPATGRPRQTCSVACRVAVWRS